MSKRTPSKERGCDGKINVGRNYRKNADRLAKKHSKTYSVYACCHCGGYHMTTKIEKAHEYDAALYVTPIEPFSMRAMPADKSAVLRSWGA